MSEDTLSGRLLADPKKRPGLLSDCERVIEQEVDSKSGLSGMAIKGAYKVVCKVKPGIIREAMDSLLDDFVGRLEGFYREHREAGGTPEAFGGALTSRSGETADALLGITDDRARAAKNKTLKATYEKLRPQAKKHVEEAVPRVSELLVRHL